MLRLSPTARRVLGLLTFCFFGSQVSSQNLVPNGSFEEGMNCPTFIANLQDECADWFFSIVPEDEMQPTPDWFHTCSEVDLLSPPDVAFGFQEPADGDGYAGIVTYRVSQNPPDYREIIGVELTESLEVGNSYLVKFKLSSLETAGYYLVNDKIGFNFSTHPTYEREAFPLNQSHFAIDTILTFSNEWTEVSVVFEADSAYNYLHIGNFFDDDNTNIVAESEFSQSGYYVIDEVSVTEALLSTHYSGDSNEIVLFPNPASTYLSVKNKMDLSEIDITIYSITGLQVHKIHLHEFNDQIKIDISNLKPGSYFFQLVTSKYMYNEVFIKK